MVVDGPWAAELRDTQPTIWDQMGCKVPSHPTMLCFHDEGLQERGLVPFHPLPHLSCDRMVSCGRDSVRLWRVRNGALRSCPVNLGEYHALEFTDLAFEEGHSAAREPDDRTL